MTEELKKKIRDLVMDTFRGWGGQWNVTPVPPGHGSVPEDRWEIMVRSNPIVRGRVSVELVNLYREGSRAPEAREKWEEALRPIFEEAKAQAP